ncbi:MAG: hypothetical protein ACI93R_000988 [Flavobacteriales bacterium]|jgi:hypothetical protein
MSDKPLNTLDIQTLEWHINSLIRRYQSIECAKEKIMNTYKHMSPEFHKEITRIFDNTSQPTKQTHTEN